MNRYDDIIKKLRSVGSTEGAEILERLQNNGKVSQAEELRRMTIERNMLARKVEELERESFRWKWHYGLPPEDNRDTLLLIASSRSTNMILDEAEVIGCYMGNGKWFLEDYPEIDDAVVKCWTPIPTPK